MKITVNKQQRYAKMRAHTATHLLHVALEKKLGQTKQEGSLVDEDYLRFDFATQKALSFDQLCEIENEINNHIKEGLSVTVEEMSIDEARQTGAKMFFGDKYGDVVRVVTIGDGLSAELCGGTHAANTREIGSFTIISQESVSSGTKRIVAYTGPRVAQYLQKKQTLVADIMTELGVAGESQLLPKIQKILTESKTQADVVSGLKAKLVGGVLAKMELTPQGRFDSIIAIEDCSDFAGLKIKTIAMEAKTVFTDKVVLFYDATGTFALVSTSEVSARDLAKELGLRGGGSPDLVQGRDLDVVQKIQ